MRIRHFGLLVTLCAMAEVLGYGQPPSANAVNFSVLVTLAPGGSATMGFVVGNLPAGQSPCTYLIRGVGPSLAAFNISNPDAWPTLTLYDSKQQQVAVINPYPAPAPPPIGIVTGYNWPAIFAAVGAFPLMSGAQDAYGLVALTPGSYTVQLVDSSGKGGAVLLEAYVSQAYAEAGIAPSSGAQQSVH